MIFMCLFLFVCTFIVYFVLCFSDTCCNIFGLFCSAFYQQPIPRSAYSLPACYCLTLPFLACLCLLLPAAPSQPACHLPPFLPSYHTPPPPQPSAPCLLPVTPTMSLPHPTWDLPVCRRLPPLFPSHHFPHHCHHHPLPLPMPCGVLYCSQILLPMPYTPFCLPPTGPSPAGF